MEMVLRVSGVCRVRFVPDISEPSLQPLLVAHFLQLAARCGIAQTLAVPPCDPAVVRQRGTEIQSAASKGALASAKALMAATVDNAAAGVIADGVGQVGDE